LISGSRGNTVATTPRPRFDQWLLAQTGRQDPVGDIAREFSDDRSVGCAGDIRTPEQLISHIERVPLNLLSAPLSRLARNTSGGASTPYARAS